MARRETAHETDSRHLHRRAARAGEQAAGSADLSDRPRMAVLGQEHLSVQAQAALLSAGRLQRAQRRSLAAEIGALHGNRYLQRVVATLHTGSQATIQRRAISKAALQAKYGITVVKGDKDWKASDITDLNWVLSKLSKPEVAALKGYQFVRWTDRASRQKADPTYSPQGDEEQGLHEADLKKGVYKISMYDTAFDKATRVELVVGGKRLGQPQLVGRIHMLHEIGHAMEIADLRAAWNAYNRASLAYNKLVTRFNAARPAAQAALKRQVDAKLRQVKALEVKMDAAKDRGLNEFKQLAKGMQPVSDYAKTSTAEAFAETYAMYKLNPRGIQLMNRKLAAWFQKRGYLLGQR